ncbi:hypothetical protein NM208_g8989 [Fusarium decemcellulare]|uniref:Uncharacterized protein n=1 Tax=Fusarium decemcellulare TaxID=57161 RepID=A0ACC1S399_9HYPO|nr:hypothetical protein NM208_g8989 [Fusarium decemcellulare]
MASNQPLKRSLLLNPSSNFCPKQLSLTLRVKMLPTWHLSSKLNVNRSPPSNLSPSLDWRLFHPVLRPGAPQSNIKDDVGLTHQPPPVSQPKSGLGQHLKLGFQPNSTSQLEPASGLETSTRVDDIRHPCPRAQSELPSSTVGNVANNGAQLGPVPRAQTADLSEGISQTDKLQPRAENIANTISQPVPISETVHPHVSPFAATTNGQDQAVAPRVSAPQPQDNIGTLTFRDKIKKLVNDCARDIKAELGAHKQQKSALSTAREQLQTAKEALAEADLDVGLDFSLLRDAREDVRIATEKLRRATELIKVCKETDSGGEESKKDIERARQKTTRRREELAKAEANLKDYDATYIAACKVQFKAQEATDELNSKIRTMEIQQEHDAQDGFVEALANNFEKIRDAVGSDQLFEVHVLSDPKARKDISQ